jgi:hypothetical protein
MKSFTAGKGDQLTGLREKGQTSNALPLAKHNSSLWAPMAACSFVDAYISQSAAAAAAPA